MPITPHCHCQTCQDWGTVVAPDGRGTVPCPGDQLTGAPCTAPKPNKAKNLEETS
jgi:hypothetical protein